MQILVTIALVVIAVLLFELIIGLHEFGHFITAKLSGIKVNEFALGMGPKLFSFKKGETQYSLRLFPIGGFCAMEGEDEDSPEPRSFNNAKVWKRMIVIIAGAVMNIILGIIFSFIMVIPQEAYSSTTVEQFDPRSYSANCGLQIGDKIVKVNGYDIYNSKDLSFSFAGVNCENVDGKSVSVYKQDCANAICTEYSKIATDKKPDDDTLLKLYNITTDGCAAVNNSADKTEAKKVMDDTVKKLYDTIGVTDYTLPTITEKDTRQRYTATVTVIRDGKEVELNDVQFFTYYKNEEDKEADKPSVSLDFYVEPIDKTFTSVIKQGFSESLSVGRMVWQSLVWIVQGRFGFKDMSGPVGIASAVTQVASQGLETNFGSAVFNILNVMTLITINLGIFNMLPFPALDGGRFLLLLIEWIFRKPIPRKVEKYINAAGFIILMGFMVVVTCKDIWQLFTGQLSL